jgi:hypothetical protein
MDFFVLLHNSYGDLLSVPARLAGTGSIPALSVRLTARVTRSAAKKQHIRFLFKMKNYL